MVERKSRGLDPTTIYLLGKIVQTGEPYEWGPYGPMPDEQVNPEHIVVGKDGVPRVPLRIYNKINGHKPIIGLETR